MKTPGIHVVILTILLILQRICLIYHERLDDVAIKIISGDNLFTVQNIANKLSMSESHLSRVFRESMGCTLGEYITKYRISMACELLKDVRLRVSQVAARVGYADARYFSVIFRRVVGTTPNRYRAQLFDRQESDT